MLFVLSTQQSDVLWQQIRQQREELAEQLGNEVGTISCAPNAHALETTKDLSCLFKMIPRSSIHEEDEGPEYKNHLNEQAAISSLGWISLCSKKNLYVNHPVPIKVCAFFRNLNVNCLRR
uniref:Uncharacterized protein n=1 Tax=Onchocerca volvulus TaxID=6282 RepID=A0A8R1TMH8_ONCVO